MMNKIERKWLVVGIIWSAVLATTGWNMVSISEIQSGRQALEGVKMDQRYLKSKETDINDVRYWNTRLTHSVKSYDLGFLVVENDLKRLFEMCGLKKMRVEGKNGTQVVSPAFIQIRAKGSIPALVKWIGAVEDAYPYLEISKLEMNADPHHRVSKLSATFVYHYSIEGYGMT